MLAQIDQGWRLLAYTGDHGSGDAGLVVGIILMIVCRIFSKKMRELFGVAYDMVLWGGVLVLSGWMATKLANGVLSWIVFFASGYIGFAMMFMFFGLIGNDRDEL